jgi:hypothetical protein
MSQLTEYYEALQRFDFMRIYYISHASMYMYMYMYVSIYMHAARRYKTDAPLTCM